MKRFNLSYHQIAILRVALEEFASNHPDVYSNDISFLVYSLNQVLL